MWYILQPTACVVLSLQERHHACDDQASQTSLSTEELEPLPWGTDGVQRRHVQVFHERQAGRGDRCEGASKRVPCDVQLAARAFLVVEPFDDREHAFGVAGAGTPHRVHPIIEALPPKTDWGFDKKFGKCFKEG